MCSGHSIYVVFRDYRTRGAIELSAVRYKTDHEHEFSSMRVSISHITRARQMMEGFEVKMASYEQRLLPGKFTANIVVDEDRPFALS